MSLLSGLFTLPFLTGFLAYKAAHFEFPLQEVPIIPVETRNRELLQAGANAFDRKRVAKTDPRYKDLLNTVDGSATGRTIKSAMQPFLDQCGIRKDLIFVETPNPEVCCALGTNMFKNSDAAVLIAPGFYAADENACNWVIKHEISHIKYNDTFTTPVVLGICQLAASIFGMCALSFLRALGLSSVVAILAYVLFSQWREAKADDFAIQNSSNEELKGGRRFLIATQEITIENRNTAWRRVMFSDSGEARLAIGHPSIRSRIQKIERALQARNVHINELEERQMIEGGVKRLHAIKTSF